MLFPSLRESKWRVKWCQPCSSCNHHQISRSGPRWSGSSNPPTTPEIVMAGESVLWWEWGWGVGRGAGRAVLCSPMYVLPPARRHSWLAQQGLLQEEEGSPVWFVGQEMARLYEQQGWGPLLCVLPASKQVLCRHDVAIRTSRAASGGTARAIWERKILPSSPVQSLLPFPGWFLHTVIYYPACFYCFLLYG